MPGFRSLIQQKTFTILVFAQIRRLLKANGDLNEFFESKRKFDFDCSLSKEKLNHIRGQMGCSRWY